MEKWTQKMIEAAEKMAKEDAIESEKIINNQPLDDENIGY